MHAWFNCSKKLNKFLQRPNMSDQEFFHRLPLSGEVALKPVKCCRTELGNAFRVPPEKLYPDDIFRDIINLPAFDWDMLYLVFSLKEILSIDIEEEQVPDWIRRDITLGEWIIDFLINVDI